MTQLISRLFGRFYSGSNDSDSSNEPEIYNEQVPWLNLEQSSSGLKIEEKGSVELHKADINFENWPGHGAPVTGGKKSANR